MGRQMPRTKRIQDSVSTGGMDLDALEAFCASARANGGDGMVVVGARITWRGMIRRLWVDVPIDTAPRPFHDPRVRLLNQHSGPQTGPQGAP